MVRTKAKQLAQTVDNWKGRQMLHVCNKQMLPMGNKQLTQVRVNWKRGGGCQRR